jgi:ubiquitin carboxyl-terminal hydrolase 5/13
MEDPDSDHEMTEEIGGGVESQDYSDSRPGVYNLKAFITHLGSGTHSGHYVCHIHKNNTWVYYNDAKVASTNDPPIGKGYMYFLRKAGSEE